MMMLSERLSALIKEGFVEINAVYVIVAREFKRFIREKSRMVAAVARPLLWLFFVGGGMSRLISYGTGLSYMQFIFPGILGMTILFSSIFSSLSIIWDREFGFMKEMMVAPISRSSIVLGKGISGSVISTFQAVIIFVFYPILGFKLGLLQILSTIGICILLSFCISLLGIIIAGFFTSFESFSVIMNFIVMPMFFLSGAMYPVKTLPHVLRLGTFINPLSYGIDALKNILYPPSMGPMSPDFTIILDVGVIFFCILLFMLLAVKTFKIKE